MTFMHVQLTYGAVRKSFPLRSWESIERHLTRYQIKETYLVERSRKTLCLYLDMRELACSHQSHCQRLPLLRGESE